MRTYESLEVVRFAAAVVDRSRLDAVNSKPNQFVLLERGIESSLLFAVDVAVAVAVAVVVNLGVAIAVAFR